MSTDTNDTETELTPIRIEMNDESVYVRNDGVVEYTGDETVEHGTTDEVFPHTDEPATE